MHIARWACDRSAWTWVGSHMIRADFDNGHLRRLRRQPACSTTAPLLAVALPPLDIVAECPGHDQGRILRFPPACMPLHQSVPEHVGGWIPGHTQGVEGGPSVYADAGEEKPAEIAQDCFDAPAPANASLQAGLRLQSAFLPPASRGTRKEDLCECTVRMALFLH